MGRVWVQVCAEMEQGYEYCDGREGEFAVLSLLANITCFYRRTVAWS